MSYAETFVTLPVSTADGDEELDLPAHKVLLMRGNAKRTSITYKDGDSIERANVPLAIAEVREMVRRGMVEWD